jgi:membrane-associated phospholipid phosphatase
MEGRLSTMAIGSQANAPSPAGESTGRDIRLVLAAVSLGLFVVPFALTLLAVQDRWEPLLGVDQGSRDGLHRYALTHPGFVTGMQLTSDFGSAAVWVVVLGLVAAWLLRRGSARFALFVVVTAAGSSLVNVAVKAAVHRLRPVLSDPVARAHGLSFPSAHAQAAIVGYGVLLVVFLPIRSRWWRACAVGFGVLAVVAIGFSRIALGVHYVSDVWAGFVLGAAWLAAMAALFDVTALSRRRLV